jgi:hypothetical protein
MNNTPNLEDFEIEIVEASSPTEEIEIVEASTNNNSLHAEAVVTEDEATFAEVSEEETLTPIEYGEWQSAQDFESYVVASARNLPPIHSDSKNSLRRAFAYLEKLSEEIIDGVEKDAPYAELQEEQLKTLDTIEMGIDHSLKELSAAISGNKSLKKVATKSSSFVYYVNPFIFGLARVLVNGKVSQGKNIEALYAKLDDKYKLNDREKLELHFILNDMGYPVRGSFVEGADFAEQYQA